jgi:hypothetical protein
LSEAIPLPVFATFKWGKGYPATYTNTLFRALRDLNSRPFRFVSITDDPTGLDDGIEAIPLPSFRLERENWNGGKWPKLAVFAPNLFPAGTPVILVDVDVVVVGDLMPMIDRIVERPGLHIIHNWPNKLEQWFPRLFNTNKRSNSSVVGFTAGGQGGIWDAFASSEFSELDRERNDQEYIHNRAENRQYWPDGWVLSFKKNVAWHFPLNLFLPVPRPDAYIVCFHGKPDPHDLAGRPFQFWGSKGKFGFFPVRWVKEYWLKYAS